MMKITPTPTVIVRCDDPVVADQLSPCQSEEQRQQKATDMVELGARVLKHMQPVEAADRILDEFTHHQQLSEERSYSLMREMAQAREETRRHLDRSVERFQWFERGQEQRVEEVLDDLKTQADRILDANERLHERNHALNRLLVQQERNPERGFRFEERVERRLRQFAQGRQDRVEAVGSRPSEGGDGKKGDILYRMGATPIVIECKPTASWWPPVTRTPRPPFWSRWADTASWWWLTKQSPFTSLWRQLSGSSKLAPKTPPLPPTLTPRRSTPSFKGWPRRPRLSLL